MKDKKHVPPSGADEALNNRVDVSSNEANVNLFGGNPELIEYFH